MVERWACQTCHFWKKGEDESTTYRSSHCRLSHVYQYNRLADDWCGEHALFRPDKSNKWDVRQGETEEQYLLRHGAIN